MVTGQNGSGQNGTDKMVWTKWYTDKMVLDEMVRTKWYGQNGTILYFVYTLIQLKSICTRTSLSMCFEWMRKDDRCLDQRYGKGYHPLLHDQRNCQSNGHKSLHGLFVVSCIRSLSQTSEIATCM